MIQCFGWKFIFRLVAANAETLYCILFHQLKAKVPTLYYEAPISSRISFVLLGLQLFEPVSRSFPIRPTFHFEVYYSKKREKTESFNKWASFSCSHGEVYPHLSQRLTPGREGVSAKARGHRLSHCELEPTWTPTECRGQRETVPGWF